MVMENIKEERFCLFFFCFAEKWHFGCQRYISYFYITFMLTVDNFISLLPLLGKKVRSLALCFCHPVKFQ